MNISTEALRDAKARDGEAAEDRSARVEEALEQSRQVGYQTGIPLVEPDTYETPQLGESNRELYEHYVGGSDLFRPDAGSFLAELFEQPEIHNVEAAANELGPSTDRQQIRKAAKLHGIDVPSTEVVDVSEDSGIRLPSGETVPEEVIDGPTDKLVLSALLSDGMSVEECARYLSEVTGSNVTVQAVRESATEANLLGGDSSRLSGPTPRPSDVHVGSGEYDSSPW